MNRSEARSRWPRAVWISGSGDWAVLAHCKVLTVVLHGTRADAEQSKAFIDRFGCTGGCIRQHRIVDTTKAGRMRSSTSMSPAHLAVVFDLQQWRDRL